MNGEERILESFEPLLVPLTQEEKAEQAERISALTARRALRAIYLEASGQTTPRR